MTTTTTTTSELLEAQPDLTQRTAGARVDLGFRLLVAGAATMVLVILGLIVISTVNAAWPAFSDQGFGMFTTARWAPNNPDGAILGILGFVYGTMVVSVISLLFAVPVSLGIALFTTEVAHPRLRSTLVSVVDLLAAVPSVVFGLWGILVMAPDIVPFYEWIARVVAPVPLLNAVLDGDTVRGRSFLTAGIILAIMITPIITSLSREVFATVPRSHKDGALALGATRWEMIKGAVLPHSFGGIVGAVMIGLGRAMGETIAVALVIGSSVQVTPNVLNSGDALPAVIANQFGESSGVHRAALIGLGVILFAITIVVNVAARMIVARTRTRMRGE